MLYDRRQGTTNLFAAAQQAGPLDARTANLVRLGMCIGAGLEGGAHLGSLLAGERRRGFRINRKG